MSDSKFHVYHIAPIDIGWDLLPTVEEIAVKLAKEEAEAAVDDRAEEYSATGFLADFREAQDLAKEAGWEGDYRGSSRPRVLFIPNDTYFTFGFVWKQDNNGSTFVISSAPMPHLRDLS